MKVRAPVQEKILGIMGTGLLALMLFAIFTRIFQWPANADEAIVFQGIERIRLGLGLYGKGSDFIYTPLYAALAGLVPSADLISSRIISGLCFLGVLSAWFIWTKRQGLSWFLAAAVGAAWLFNADLALWFAWCRVDALGFLCTVLGLIWLDHRPRSTWPWLCFALALMVKQTFLAAPLAGLIWLGLRDRTLMLRGGAHFLAYSLLLFCAAAWVTQGTMVGSLSRAGMACWEPKALAFYLKTWPRAYPVPMFALLWGAWFLRGSLWSVYAMCSLPLAFFWLLRCGSATNFWFEPMLAGGALMAGLYLQYQKKAEFFGAGWARIFLLLALMLNILKWLRS
jgi:hypothetical protein